METKQDERRRQGVEGVQTGHREDLQGICFSPSEAKASGRLCGERSPIQKEKKKSQVALSGKTAQGKARTEVG